jgi:hypothetical protein
VFHAQARAAATEAPIVADGLGEGTIPLDGSWLFHLGDDTSWANPVFDDFHWEQLSAETPWGKLDHFDYTGFARYRRRLDISIAPGASPDVALFVPSIDDAYQIYWNGMEDGHLGSLPPHIVPYEGVLPQAFGLGQMRTGVLAISVWKASYRILGLAPT